MKLEATGKIATGRYDLEWKGLTICGYIATNGRLELLPAPVDPERRYISKVKCDPKGRVPLKAMLKKLYGEIPECLLAYRQGDSLLIEKDISFF